LLSGDVIGWRFGWRVKWSWNQHCDGAANCSTGNCPRNSECKWWFTFWTSGNSFCYSLTNNSFTLVFVGPFLWAPGWALGFIFLVSTYVIVSNILIWTAFATTSAATSKYFFEDRDLEGHLFIGFSSLLFMVAYMYVYLPVISSQVLC
jgi:hypothetical protein